MVVFELPVNYTSAASKLEVSLNTLTAVMCTVIDLSGWMLGLWGFVRLVMMAAGAGRDCDVPQAQEGLAADVQAQAGRRQAASQQ